MLQLDQKTICLIIKDGLTEIFPEYQVKWNKEYTRVQLVTTSKLRNIKLSEKIMQIFDCLPCLLYRPFHNNFKRFVVVVLDHYADIEIVEPTRCNRGKWIYNIYIMVPNSKIQYEWWYDQFLSSI